MIHIVSRKNIFPRVYLFITCVRKEKKESKEESTSFQRLILREILKFNDQRDGEAETKLQRSFFASFYSLKRDLCMKKLRVHSQEEPEIIRANNSSWFSVRTHRYLLRSILILHYKFVPAYRRKPSEESWVAPIALHLPIIRPRIIMRIRIFIKTNETTESKSR